MKWSKIKENNEWGARPYIKHPIDEEENHEYELKIPCLVKYTEDYVKGIYGDNIKLNLSHYIHKWFYDVDSDSWYDDNNKYVCQFETDNVIESYILLDEIDRMLSGVPEPLWCWEYGYTLAETSIPALAKWIEYGYSYPQNISLESWKEILNKIKYAFEVSLDDFNYDNMDWVNAKSKEEKSNLLKEKEDKLEEHKKIRKEAFELLAEYYMDMWD